MNILGINGLGHNPSACLLTDGGLEAFAAEERFNRMKDSFGMMPLRASSFCLSNTNNTLKDIDAIAFGWDAPLYDYKMPLFVLKTALRYSSSFNSKENMYKAIEQLIKYRSTNVKRLIAEMFLNAGYKGEMPPVSFFSHHHAHAASAYYTSGYDRAHIIVADGSGENRCTSIFRAEGKSLKLIKTFPIPHSLGWFYQSITEWLGFTPNSHEGKTMALAAYGKHNVDISNKLKSMLHVKTNGDYTYDPSYSHSGLHTSGNIYSDKTTALLGKARSKEEPLTPLHFDVAFSAQELLESVMLNLVGEVINEKDFSGNLCMAGGVALNCKMNGKVALIHKVKNIFIPPFCSDEGVALGAALLYREANGIDPRFEMKHAYYGPSFNNADIERFLTSTNISYSKPPNIVETVAQLLFEGKIVGWFQGAMEIGARALGNRSILANPTLLGMKNRVNAEVKGREQWRPFAASLLFEEKEAYVESAHASPFMTIAFNVKKKALEKIPESIHIDGTTRPQFVTESDNPLFYALIKAFGEKSGVNALLNTSLNTNEEPIVCTPQQAVSAFFSSGLEVLAIGDYLLQKRE